MTNYKTLAVLFNKEMNFNVLPLKWKKPMIQWDKWQSEIQTEDDISKMNWSTATGLGAIMGVNELRVIDFDGVVDKSIIEKFLNELGFPKDYIG